MTRLRPLVSVVVAVRNGEPYIGRTLASALAQTLTDIEVVVVDDGSEDTTAATVESIAANDPRVRLIRTPPTGVAAARNRAIEESRSDLVAVLDGDDLWHPTKLALQAEAFRAGPPGVAAVGCLALTVDQDDRLIASIPSFGPRTLRDLDGFALLPFTICPLPWCASMPVFARTPFLEIGGYDTTLRKSEDYELAARLAERHPFSIVPRFLVGYRHTLDSRSSDPAANLRAELAILNEIAARNPWMPRHVLRWTRARRHVFAAARSLNKGDLVGAMRHGAQAVACDPAVLLQADAIPAALALLTRRGTAHEASRLEFPADRDTFLAQAPASVVPGQHVIEAAVDAIEWRRHLSMRRTEARHHAIVDA